MRFFIELSYNGRDYHGWQYQPNAISVQEVIEQTLSTLFHETLRLVGAGRTDTGVHAQQMFAHFDATLDFSTEKLIFNFNSFLPKDIAIHNIFKVDNKAHARFDAISRTYKYIIKIPKNAFSFNNAYYLKSELNVEKMNDAAKILLDYENFQCFSKSNRDVPPYNCKIIEAEWAGVKNELIFTIKANRFLRNMVRAIVGTMINIGSGKLNVEQLHDIIKSQDRTKAGASVPGYALYLTKIEYPKHIMKQ